MGEGGPMVIHSNLHPKGAEGRGGVLTGGPVYPSDAHPMGTTGPMVFLHSDDMVAARCSPS